ncbi:MAG: phosphotransferase [Acidimicrobiales bacterium]
MPGPAAGSRAPTPAGLADVSAAWLTAALREGGAAKDLEVAAVRVEPLGEGVGFLGQLARLHVAYGLSSGGGDGPATLILKLPTDDAGGREVGRMLGVWARESRFFSHVAPELAGVAKTPRCYYNGADHEAERYALLLEDLTPPSRADQLVGADAAQAAAAVEAIGRVHARWWGTAHDAFTWMPGFHLPGVRALQHAIEAALPAFAEQYAGRVAPETVEWLARFAPTLSAWIERKAAEPLTLVHADYRLDNLLFAATGEVAILDWQTALCGPGAMDLASFCVTSLTTADRRQLEPELFERYRRALRAGGVELDAATLTRSYREHLLWWMGIFANNLSRIRPVDERGRAPFDQTIERTFAAAADHAVGELLPLA